MKRIVIALAAILALHGAAAALIHTDLIANPKMVFVGVDTSNRMAPEWGNAQRAIATLEQSYHGYVVATEKAPASRADALVEAFAKRQAYGPRDLGAIHAAGERSGIKDKVIVTNAPESELGRPGSDFAGWRIIRP